MFLAEGLDRLARKDTTDGSPSKNKAEKKKATGDDKKAAADVKTPAPSKVLPAYFRQSIYWPPYKRTLANITSLPVVEVAMDKTAELHDRLKGVVIFGTLYRFNVWWVAYLRDCAQEALRMFRKTNQRLTPPGKY